MEKHDWIVLLLLGTSQLICFPPCFTSQYACSAFYTARLWKDCYSDSEVWLVEVVRE
jgi:hypothetical protein